MCIFFVYDKIENKTNRITDKINKIFAIITCLLAVISLSACSQNSSIKITEETQLNIEYTSEWMDNEYTQTIIKPTDFIMDYYIDNSENNSFTIALKEVSEDEKNAYIEELKKNGYNEITSDENNYSSGILLNKENVNLSVAHSETFIVIGITITE